MQPSGSYWQKHRDGHYVAVLTGCLMPSAEPLMGSAATQSQFATSAIDNVIDQEQSQPESGSRLGFGRPNESAGRGRKKLSIHALTMIDYLETSSAVNGVDNDRHRRVAVHCSVV